MNQKTYTIAIIAVIGFVTGAVVGILLDDARDASIDPNRQGAFVACKICPDALFPYMGEVVNINLGLIFGAVAGAGIGGLLGWALSGPRGSQGATFTGSKGSTADDTLIASRSTLTTQSIHARAAPTDETLARQMEQLTALTKADASLHESFDAQKILMRAHDEAMRLSQADFASLILLDWLAPMRGKATRVGTAIDYERFSPSEENVLATNRSHLIGSYENEPETPLIAGVRSSLFVPIAYDDRVIGLIGLHSEKPSAFKAEIQEVVEVLAAQTAVALGNAHRYEEQIQRGELLRSRADQLQSLFKIATSIQPEHSLAANLETIAFGIQQSAGFNVAVVSVINPTTHQLERMAAAGLPVATFDQLKQATQSWDMYRTYLRADYQLGAAYFIPREHAEELYRPFDRIEAAKSGEAQSTESWRRGDVLLLPIYSATSEPLGLIQLDDPRSGKAPTQAVVDVLELFTGPAMLVIENAHLLDAARERINESQERAQQLEALGEASNVIARALRREEVVAVSLEQLRRVVPYDRATLYLRDAADGRFRVGASRSRDGEADWIGMAPELIDRSLFAEIAANRRVLVVTDISGDSRFPKSSQQVRGAWLGVPLLSKGDVVGVLGLDKLETGYYAASHTHVATAFANQMSVALENARLLEENIDRAAELNQRIHRTTLLNTIAFELVGSLDVERAARTVIKALAESLSAQSGAVLLLDESSADTARLQRTFGSASQVVSLEGVGAESLIPRLRGSTEPLILQGAELLVQAAWVGASVRQAIILLLATNDTLLGLMALGRETENDFTPDDIEVAKGAAAQAAVMIHNARQYQKAQQRIVELSSVAQASRVLVAELEFKRLSDVIRAQIAGLTGAQNFVVALYDETRNELSFPVAVEGGAVVEKSPMAPGGVSQFLIQSRNSLLLGLDSESRLRAVGVPDLAARAGAWDAVSGEVYLGVPLILNNQAIGLIALADTRADAFGEAHERLLNAVAPQLAAAIEHSRQYEQIRQAAASVRNRLTELQERATQLQALNEASLGLSSTLRSAEVLSLVADQLQNILPYDRLTIWLRDESGQMATVLTRGAGAPVLDTPLYGQVAAAHSSVVVSDVTADEHNRASTKGAWLGLPLLNRGELAGLIGLDKDETGFYTDRHAALADAFGSQVANAIANARLFENSLERVHVLNERTNRFAVLNRISTELSGLLDVAALAETGARQLAAALNSEAAGVMLFDDDPQITARHPATERAWHVAPSDSLIERLRGSLAPVSLETIDEADARWLGGSFQSALLLPLVIHDDLRGVAFVGEKKAARHYSDDAIELGSTITHYISAAVQNARLYQRTQRRMVELGSLSQIGRAVSGTIEHQKLYAAVREQVRGLFNADSLCVALYDQTRSEVSYPLLERDGKPVELKPHAPAGLIWYVLRTQQSLLLTGGADDKHKGQALSMAADKANALRGKSFLGAPLIVEDRTIGVLAVASSRPSAFEPEHENLMTGVASQVAAAIENARLFEAGAQRADELYARVQTLTVINRVAARLNGLLDSRRVLAVAARELADVLSADRVSVVALGDGTEMAAYPEFDTGTEQLALDDGWLMELARARLQPVALDAASEVLAAPIHAAWLGEGLKAALILPLAAEDKLIGVASVGMLSPREFSSDEIATATQISLHIVGALHHARQYEAASQRGDSLSERAQRLSILTRASSEMNRSLESERVMEIGLKELATATQSDVVYGARLDDGGKKAARQSAGVVAEAAAPAEGDAVIEQLRETLSPVVVSEPSKRAPWIGEGVQTAIALPLAAHGKLIGVAAIASSAAREWAAGELELATALANEMAVALHNACLHERTLKRLVELGAIAQSTRAVSGSVELSKLYDIVRTQVGSLVGAKTMSLALYDEARNEVSFPVMVKDGRSVDVKPTAPNPVLWRIIQTQQSLRWSRSDEAPLQELGITHAGNGKGNGSNGANGSNSAYGKSYVGVPLVAGKKTIGVLSVTDEERDDAFDAEHERVLQTLASQVASALDSARLYETAQRKVQSLEGRLQILSTVNRAALEMSRTLDPMRVLEIGLNELGRLPAVDGAVAVLYENGQPVLYKDGKRVEAAVGPGEHDPLVEYIRQSRAPLAIADLDNDLLAKPISRAWLGTEATSALVLPLTAEGAWLGLAALSVNAPRTFSPDDTDWATALAGQMASALHHARQYDSAERRLTEAVTVNGALRAIQRANDLPQLWDALRLQVTALAGVDTMVLQLYDETTGEVAVPLLVRKGETSESEPQMPGAITRHVIVTQRPLLLNGSLRESAAAAGIAIHDGDSGEVIAGNSLLAVPLRHGDHVTGVLVLASDTANVLNDKHITVLTALAVPFAAALENARTLARTRGELVREQSLIEQSRATAQELDGRLQESVEELTRLRQEQQGSSHEVTRLRDQQIAIEQEFEQVQAELARLRERETGHLRRETQFDFLLRFTEELTADDPSTMLKRALLTAGESIHAEFGALFLRAPNSPQLKQAVAFGPQRALDSATTAFAANEGLVGWVYSNRAALRLTGLADDGRWRSRPVVKDKQYQAALVAPLLAMGQVEGVWAFLNPADHPFSASHEQLMTAAARQLALAVRRADEPHAAVVVPTQARRDEAVTSTANVVPLVLPELTTEVVTTPERVDQETTSVEPESIFASEHTAAPGLEAQPVEADATTDTVRVPVPTANDSNTDATLIQPRRAPLANDTVLEEISPSELQFVGDVDYAEPPAGINPILLVGLVLALIVGAFLITFLITSGGFSSLFGGTQQPTQIVVVTNAPTSTTANQIVATTAPTLAPTFTLAPSSTPTETELPTETPTETAVPTETPTVGPTLPPGVVALGTIQVTQGTSARLRASPNGTVVGSVPDDTAVQVLQGQEFVDGISWIQIRLPSGEVGWIAESLVEIATSP